MVAVFKINPTAPLLFFGMFCLWMGAAWSAPAGIPSGLSITASSYFSNPAPRSGDSLKYIVKVEWEDTGIPVTVMAPESLSFKGLRKVGQSTIHKKMAKADGIRRDINQTEFIFQLQALTPGSARISQAKLRYWTPVSASGEEEFVFVAPGIIDILPALRPFTESPWFQFGLPSLGLALLGWGVWGGMSLLRRRRAAKKAGQPSEPDFQDSLIALKRRLEVAESRDVAHEMESIAAHFLRMRLKDSPGHPNNTLKFDVLLKMYLEGQGIERESEWRNLRDFFEQSRFSAERKPAHELSEKYVMLRKCLGVEEEKEK